MLTSIASYLFGFGTEDAPADDSAAPSEEQGQEKLTAIETDGDWILVDKYDKSPIPSDDEGMILNEPAESKSLVERRRRRNRRRRYNPNLPSQSSTTCGPLKLCTPPILCIPPSLPAFYSLPGAPTSVSVLEDSWYITPPPCFTADSGPFDVPSSPMEDLLIEHPSMSVYEKIQPKYLRSLFDAEMLKSIMEVQIPCMKVTRRARLADARLDALAEVLADARATCAQFHTLSLSQIRSIDRHAVMLALTAKQVLERNSELPPGDLTSKRSASIDDGAAAAASRTTDSGKAPHVILLLSHPGQKVKQRQQVKLLHRKQLERHNKVQEFESIGKKQRRKDFMRSPSGKSNNRKY